MKFTEFIITYVQKKRKEKIKMEYLNTNFPGLKELLGENYQNKKEEVKFVPCSSQKILK